MRRVVAAVALSAAAAVSASAQARPSLSIELPPDSLLTRRGPLLRATSMLAGERIRELMAAGFPARFHYRVELWSEGRFWASFETAAEFDVLARYLPAEKLYEVIHVERDHAQSLGRFANAADAERAIGRAIPAPMAARRSSRAQYYQATLTVQALSEKDLDEVAQWLRGDVEPGLTGSANPTSVIARGVRTLAASLLGGEKLEYVATSPHFRTP